MKPSMCSLLLHVELRIQDAPNYSLLTVECLAVSLYLMLSV